MIERGKDLEGQRFSERFSLLESDETRKSLGLFVDQLRQSREPLGALVEWRAAPELGRERRRLDGVLDLGRIGTRDPRERLSRRRVHVGNAGPGPDPRLPVDQGQEGWRASWRTRTVEVFHD